MPSSNTSAAPSVTERYTRHVALRHERLYGRGYQGPGSEEVFEALAARVDLRAGARLLDVGSGLGGDSFRLAQRFGLSVVGLDAAPDMTAICQERAQEYDSLDVSFVSGDIRTVDLRSESFDVVWTRDCGLYFPVPEKPRMWSRIYQLLKPGGQVLLTDYSRGRTDASARFEEHLTTTGQHPVAISEYTAIVESVGFADVTAEDRTEDLLGSLLRERKRLVDEEADFLTDFSRAEYDTVLDRWNKKIAWCESGELSWTVLTARRPSL